MATYYDKEVINKVKESVNLLELASKYTTLKKLNKTTWQGCCPHPDHDDSTSSFTVYYKAKEKPSNRWSWNCFGCNTGKINYKYKTYGSDCISFLIWLSDSKNSKHKLSFTESLEKCAKFANVNIKNNNDVVFYKQFKDYTSYKTSIARAAHSNVGIAMNYLSDRGLDKETIDKFLIGYNGDRITIPLFNKENQVIGFSNRHFNNSKNPAKYINTGNNKYFNKSKYIFCENFIEDDYDYVLVTEGTLDPIVAYRFGFHNVIATLGSSFTEDHAMIIAKLNKTPIFCYDNDKAGIHATEVAIDRMQNLGIYSKVIVLPDGMDLADYCLLKQDRAIDILDKALSYWEYRLNPLISTYKAQQNELLLKLYPEIRKTIISIKNPDEKFIFQQYIKNNLNLEVS